MNLMRSNKTKGKVLHLGWDKPQYQHRLGAEGSERSPEEERLEVPVDEKLDMTWQCSLIAQRSWTR